MSEQVTQQPELVEEVDCDLLSLHPCPLSLTPDEQAVTDYLRLVARYEAERERIQAGAAALLRRVESKLRSLEFLRGSEVRAATARLIAGKKTKSFATVYGTAGFRRLPERLAVVDEDAILAPFIRTETKTVQSIDRAALTEHYKATGEIPAGCDVKPAEEVFYAKPTPPAGSQRGEQAQEKSA